MTSATSGGTTFRDTVVLAAANPWHGVRMADRQLAEELAAYAPVLYVDPPSSPVSHLRRSGDQRPALRPEIELLGPGLARLAPVLLPGLARPGVQPVNAALLAAQARWAVRKLRGTTYAVLESSVLLPIAGRCGERLTAYWAQDDFIGGAAVLGIPADRAEHGEEHLMRIADVIVAANPLVRDSVAARSGKDVQMIPFGCNAELFAGVPGATPAPGVTLPQPIAGFMGYLGERIDLEILDAVSRTGASLLMVGAVHPRADASLMRAILDRPNVQWVGESTFEDLPGWLAHMHTGLIPYNHSAFNEGSFPLKMLEYLAAGLPVVATDLPAVRWLASEHIDIEDTPETFAAAVTTSLAAPRDAAGVAARQEFARQHSWAERARAFATALGLPAAGSPGTPSA